MANLQNQIDDCILCFESLDSSNTVVVENGNPNLIAKSKIREDGISKKPFMPKTLSII